MLSPLLAPKGGQLLKLIPRLLPLRVGPAGGSAVTVALTGGKLHPKLHAAQPGVHLLLTVPLSQGQHRP